MNPVTTQSVEYSSQIRELAKMNLILLKKGGPPEDAELFDQILDLRDGILRSFGLPKTFDNEKILWFEKSPTDSEIDKTIEALHKTAIHYLSGNTKTELQTLRDAQEKSLGAFTVLPELKITTHAYTIFVYEKMLLKRKDTVENILHELRLVNDPDILYSIGQIGQGNRSDEAEVVSSLENMGVKYIQQFNADNSGLIGDDDY